MAGSYAIDLSGRAMCAPATHAASQVTASTCCILMTLHNAAMICYILHNCEDWP